MISGFEYGLIALAVALLLYSGAWTDRTYSRFDQIPAHYDLHGNATRLTSRRQMAWALPIGFSLMLFGLALLLTFLPPDRVHGNPKVAIWSFLLGLPAAQGLVLWLLARWASKQH